MLVYSLFFHSMLRNKIFYFAICIIKNFKIFHYILLKERKRNIQTFSNFFHILLIFIKIFIHYFLIIFETKYFAIYKLISKYSIILLKERNKIFELFRIFFTSFLCSFIHYFSIVCFETKYFISSYTN